MSKHAPGCVVVQFIRGGLDCEPCLSCTLPKLRKGRCAVRARAYVCGGGGGGGASHRHARAHTPMIVHIRIRTRTCSIRLSRRKRAKHTQTEHAVPTYRMDGCVCLLRLLPRLLLWLLLQLRVWPSLAPLDWFAADRACACV